MPPLKSKLVCSDCMGDPILSEQIAKDKNINTCGYCNNKNPCITLRELAEKVDIVYRENYQLGEEYPSYINSDDRVGWEQKGDYPETIISEMLEVEQSVASDITEFLSEQEQYDVVRCGANAVYDDTSFYQEKEISAGEHIFIWEEFCAKLKHKSRFYNESTISLLNDLFSEIQDLKLADEKSPIRIIGGEKKERFIFRARKATSEKDRIRICLNPGRELGPPPQHKAKAARMNPTGISVFYGALERETCLAEIRLIPGEMAISGKFEIIKPLTALDLTALKKVYLNLSMFDPRYFQKKSKLKFLRNFESMINLPVLPDDEPLDYIPSQALVEYLSDHFNPRIDAIIYSSIQNDKQGKNIAILSPVLKAGYSEGKFGENNNSSKYEESWGDEYIIWVKSTPETICNRESKGIKVKTSKDNEKSVNTKSLQLVDESLNIHEILGIQYKFKTGRISILIDDLKD